MLCTHYVTAMCVTVMNKPMLLLYLTFEFVCSLLGVMNNVFILDTKQHIFLFKVNFFIWWLCPLLLALFDSLHICKLCSIMASFICYTKWSTFTAFLSWSVLILPFGIIFKFWGQRNSDKLFCWAELCSSWQIICTNIQIFSLTFTKVNEEQIQVSKMQRYRIIREYHSRSRVPPPFSLIAYLCSIVRGKWCPSKKPSRSEAFGEKNKMIMFTFY